MVDEHRLYVPWYEASPDGLDELAVIKRTVDQLRTRHDGAALPRRAGLTA